MDWKEVFKNIAIGAGIVGVVGVAAFVGWEAAIAAGFGIWGKIAVGTITTAVLAYLFKKTMEAKKEKTVAPVVLNVVPNPRDSKQKENQIERERQNDQIRGKQRPPRRRFGRTPAKLIARLRARRTQQKENQREAA